MTAINLLMMPDAVHLFTDAGHFLNDSDLAALGGKVIPLPQWNAVAVFHGPSLGGPVLREHLSKARGDWHNATLDAVAQIEQSGALGGRDFSVIVAGHNGKNPFGIAIEQGGMVHRLGVGSIIKALDCGTAFNPDDIVSSGVRMMEEQRQRHGVVAGWCDYTLVSAHGIEGPKQLVKWNDLIVPGAGALSSAKIGNLQVDTINFDYMTGFVTGTDSITVTNPANLPVDVYYNTLCTAIPGNVSGTSYSVRIRVSVVRTRGNLTYYNRLQTFSGSGATFTISGGILDYDSVAGDVYTFNTSYTSGNSSAFAIFDNKSIAGRMVER